MTTECQKAKETPPKCALCSGEHTANYMGCTVYKELQNASGKQTNRNQQLLDRQSSTPHTINLPNPQEHLPTSTTYSQVLSSNHMTNELDSLGLQLNTLLNEFKAMFTQLINQNNMILSMLSTVTNNTLNSGH
jgi:hypothetical protein